MAHKIPKTQSNHLTLAEFPRAPLAAAIRQTLVVSVVTIALTGTGQAFAAPTCTQLGASVTCVGDGALANNPDFPTGIAMLVDDLSLVVGSAATLGTVDVTTVENFGVGVSAGQDSLVDGYSGSVTVTSYADIVAKADAVRTVAGIRAGSQQDDVAVDSRGAITSIANGYGYAAATGIGASIFSFSDKSEGNLTVAHSGTLSVAAATDGFASAYGIQADNGSYRSSGDVSVDNSGMVSTTAEGYSATVDGILAVGRRGDVTVDNSGTLNAAAAAQSFAQANGIDAFNRVYSGDGDYGEVTVVNNSTVSATATAVGISAAAGGIRAVNRNGTAMVNNSGAVSAVATAGNFASANGIYAANRGSRSYGDVTVDNSGSISATATTTIYRSGAFARGIGAVKEDGAMNVANSGTVSATAIAENSAKAYGIDVIGGFGIFGGSSSHGDVMVDNSGAVTVVATAAAAEAFFLYGAYAQGIRATNGHGAVTVANSGSVSATATAVAENSARAYGIAAYSRSYDSYGVLLVDNSGSVSATATAEGFVATVEGIRAGVSNGALTVHNSGAVSAEAVADGLATANGINAFGGYSSYGDVVVDNSDGVSATAYSAVDAFADGIQVVNRHGNATVDNSGAVSAAAVAQVSAEANGIYASNTSGAVTLDNSGAVRTAAVAAAIARATGMYVSSSGDVTVNNGGAVSATAKATAPATAYFFPLAYVDGIHAVVQGGDVTVANSGTVSASTVAENFVWANGIYAFRSGYRSSGDVTVDNSGAVSATAEGYNVTINGIHAVNRYGDVTVANSGTVSSTAAAESAIRSANGIYAATSGYGSFGYDSFGDVTVDNSGTVSATATTEGFYAKVNGISAVNRHGDVAVANSGTVSATAVADSIASANGIHVANRGYRSYGDVMVDDSGTVSVTADGYYATVNGILAIDALGDVAVVHRGAVSAVAVGEGFASAYGIRTINRNGDATVDNSGAVRASASVHIVAGTPDITTRAFGVHVDYGVAVNLANSGDITASAISSSGDVETAGIHAATTDTSGFIGITNNGAVGASASAAAGSAHSYGIDAGIDAYGYSADTGGSITVNNAATGAITTSASAYTDGFVYGIRAATTAANGNVTIGNSGALTAAATSTGDDAYATGIDATALGEFGDLAIYSGGATTATATADDDAHAEGIHAEAGNGARVVNSGALDAAASSDDDRGFARGIGAYATTGDVLVSNTLAGTVAVKATGPDGTDAVGIRAQGAVNARGANTGAIQVAATSDDGPSAALGIDAQGDTGAVLVTNMLTGTIDVSALASGDAHATGITAATGGGEGAALDFANDSTITVTATAGAGAAGHALGVELAARQVGMVNTGDIIATAAAGPGGSSLAAALAIHATDTSTLLNTGTISAQYAVMSDGTSADYLRNEGTLNGAVALGAGDDRLVNVSSDTWNATGVSSFGDGDDSLLNAASGHLAMTNATIDMGSFTSTGNVFVNAGLINVTGGNHINMGAGNPNPFTNTGTINFVDGDTGDSLSLVGNFSGTGTAAFDVDTQTQTADKLVIQGDVVGGQTTVDVVLAGEPKALHTSVELVNVSGTASPDAFVPGTLSGIADSFLAFDYTLFPNPSDAGVSLGIDIAGLSASGALLTSVSPAVQNLWHTAVGNLYQREGAARDQFAEPLGVWVRGFGSDGTLSPAGAQANADFDQENQGFEAGFEFAPRSDLRIGLLAGQAKAKIDLDASTGRADIDGDTFGAYLTWRAWNGAYADLSYRWMNIDADTHSSIGSFSLDGDADGWSFEAGYPIRLPDGMIVEPQFQFSALEVELDDVSNSLGTIELEDGDSQVVRAGAQIRKTYAVAEGVTLTPSWSVNAVTELEGKNDFRVNGIYRDKTDLGGTSLLAEGGLNVKLGTKVEVFGGMNYQDGAAFDSVVGGQVGVRGRW